jgi:hypothetical protein
MSISRRGFFRGLTGKNDPQHEQQKRQQAIESYVRTNLLPYDFGLTMEQTAEVLAAAVSGAEIDPEGELLTWESRTRIREIVDEKVERWRDDYLKAEAVRRESPAFVDEFLSSEATSEDQEKLRQRFHCTVPEGLKEEIELHVRAWLGDLPNARLAVLDRISARALVFSEIRSWC